MPTWTAFAAHRRVWKSLLVGVLVTAVTALVWTVLVDGMEDPAVVIGLVVGVASLGATVAALFPRPERLVPDPAALAADLAGAVDRQWREEIRARRLREPRVLPLTWSAGTRGVGDVVAAGPAGSGGRVLRVNLDGRLQGTLQEATRRLAAGYTDVRSGRLVLLGEPGAGKTVLAVLLTVGLLDARRDGRPVPVLLSVSSWDPVCQALDDWIVDTLAAAYYNGQVDIPRTLLDRGLLLPVLDGLDEIPESARRSAIRGINHAIGADRPIVITCRSAEYEDVIRGGAPVLLQAPVVEVQPVSVADVVAYLADVAWPEDVDWRPVFDRLRHDPTGPLAEALSTPLMVSLARHNYGRCGGDPAELLDAGRFASRHDVEDHLLDRAIPAAYAPQRLPSGEPAEPPGRWDAAQAHRWLVFLAQYLHQHRERDLAWWRLSQRLLSSWVAPGIGLATGVLLMIIISAATPAVSTDTEIDLAGTLGVGAFAGATFAVLAMIIWYASVGRPPGRLAMTARGTSARLRRGFAAGVGLVAIPAVPALLGGAVAAQIIDDWAFSGVAVGGSLLAVAVAVAGVLGMALAVENWLNAPPARAVQAGPVEFIRQDRRSSLAGALAAGAVVALTGAPALLLALAAGDVLGQGFASWLGMPGTATPAFGEGTNFTSDGPLPTSPSKWPLMVAAVVVLPGTVVTLLVLLTRAWPRFVVARLVLALRGRLPWRLLAFLADARDRELLRQSGGTYQFRHIRLQERLATRPLPPGAGRRHAVHRGAAEPVRRLRRLAAPATVVALLAVATLGAGITANHLSCQPLYNVGDAPTQSRVFTGTDSTCVGVVPEERWEADVAADLEQDGPAKEVFADLRTGNETARKAPTRILIGVLGPLRTPRQNTSPVLLRWITGILLAQRRSRQTTPIEVVLADTGPDDDAREAARQNVFQYADEADMQPTAMLWLGPDGLRVEPVEPDDPIDNTLIPRMLNDAAAEPVTWYDYVDTGDKDFYYRAGAVLAPWVDDRRHVMLRGFTQPETLTPTWSSIEGLTTGHHGDAGEYNTRVNDPEDAARAVCTRRGFDAVVYEGPADWFEQFLDTLSRCDRRVPVLTTNAYLLNVLVTREPRPEALRRINLYFPAPANTTTVTNCAHLRHDDFHSAYNAFLGPTHACAADAGQAESSYRMALLAADPRRWPAATSQDAPAPPKPTTTSPDSPARPSAGTPVDPQAAAVMNHRFVMQPTDQGWKVSASRRFGQSPL